MMDEEIINGFGERLNKMEVCSQVLQVKVERSENDIQTIFGKLEEIKKSVDGIGWKIFAGISIPTLLVLLQMILKSKG